MLGSLDFTEISSQAFSETHAQILLIEKDNGIDKIQNSIQNKVSSTYPAPP